MSELHKFTMGHSPDADDAFMAYPIIKGYVDTYGFEIEEVMADIQTLNQWAQEERLDVTALSAYGYGWVSERYDLVPYGASVGRMYGPIVVAPQPQGYNYLKTCRIAVPGEQTTAFLILKLMLGDFDYSIVNFQEIPERVQKGEFGAGLVIHEGQLTFSDYGLVKVADMGEWWYETTALPLPLGVNAIRKSLPLETKKLLACILRDGVQWALDHRGESIQYASQFSGSVDEKRLNRFIEMYVNQDSRDWGSELERAINLLYKLAKEKSLLPSTAEVNLIRG